MWGARVGGTCGGHVWGAFVPCLLDPGPTHVVDPLCRVLRTGPLPYHRLSYRYSYHRHSRNCNMSRALHPFSSRLFLRSCVTPSCGG